MARLPLQVPASAAALPEAEVSVAGVGLHTGKRFQLRIAPAQNPGLEFVAVFAGTEFRAPALWTRISALSRSTSLVLRGESRRKLELRTVEHFLAAALMSGLRRARIDLRCLEGDSEILELPALTGAAAGFLPLIRSASNSCFAWPDEGCVAWRCVRAFEVKDGVRRITFSPVDLPQTQWECHVEFPPSWRQQVTFTSDWRNPSDSLERFARDLAPARTFGFTRELVMLAQKGLARGGSLENALLLDEDKIVNPEGFLFANELAAHKLVDAMGDFALLGGPLLARVELARAGHEMHASALREAVAAKALQPGRLLSNGEFVPEN